MPGTILQAKNGEKERSSIQLRKEPITKNDSDSGLDDSSDSCSSCEEEQSRGSSSDSDTRSNGEPPIRPERKKKKSLSYDSEDPPADAEATKKCPSRLLFEKPVLKVKPYPSKSAKPPENLTNVEDLPEFFRILLEGQYEEVEFSMCLKPRPDWLDEEKFKRGQKFAASNLFSLNFAEMLSLIMLFAPKSVLKPLIFTGKSDSPYKAFRRYLNTLMKLKSWYETDMWGDEPSEGKKNIITVNRMHLNVYTGLTQLPAEEVERKTSLGDPRTTALWCPMTDLMREDFLSSCPASSRFLENAKSEVWINQLDMSVTQFGFVGLAVTYPTYFGLHYASYEDLDAFVHMWRGLGYLLGIKDCYNFCNADLPVVQQRTRDYIEISVKPSFRQVSEEWEHMCRCMVSGIAFYVPVVEFESALLYLCYTIGVDMPKLKKSISLNHYLRYLSHRMVNALERVPGVLPRLNRRLDTFIRAARDAPPEILAKWEAKEFEYMRQAGKCPIRHR